MKKFIIALCALLALTFVFVGCKDKNKDNNQEPSQQTPSYTIQWIDETGNTITTTRVNKGDRPAYQYNVSDTAEWDYTFLGWANSPNGEILETLPSADKDCSYYARVSKVKQKYTVTFNTLVAVTLMNKLLNTEARLLSHKHQRARDIDLRVGV